jgi:anti-sigma regulatory factor (Ser/Thr protein kinase)
MPQLTLPATLAQLEPINEFIAANTPAEYKNQQANIELVAEELLVNVFSYAYPEGADGKAEVALREVHFDGEKLLCFSVMDWGAPFNPFAEAPEPDLTLDTESRPIGGLGIFLIRSVSKHQAYTRDEGANIIEIYFAVTESE